MGKRNLFAELSAGFDALADERAGKVELKTTLRTMEVEAKPALKVTAVELIALRKRLNVSRAVMANYLRTKTRTLENWELGRAKPNAQAATLIKLVEKYPDTVTRLAELAP